MVFEGGLFSTTGILVITAIIVAIWVIIEVKRFKHKIFAIFLMFLIVFLYFGAFAVFQDRELDLTSMSGITQATKLYMSWLGSMFGNFKSITGNVIHLDWKGNGTFVP